MLWLQCYLDLYGIIFIDNRKDNIINIVIAVIIAISATILNTDYGMYGVVLIYILYLFRDKKVLLGLFFTLNVVVHYYQIFGKSLFLNYNYLRIVGVFLALIPIYLYNGKKGKSGKYFFYLFYPIHLLLLYVIHFFV